MSETPRIFVSPDFINTNDGIIIINDKNELHHLINVLRIKPDNIIIILDNQCNSYLSKVVSIEKKEIRATIISCEQLLKYPETNITLIQSILKPDNHDFVVQKSTELGINKVINIISKFSNIKKADEKTIDRKKERWQKIALNAAKQSKRPTIPEISFYRNLEEFFNKNQDYPDKCFALACIEKDFAPSIKTLIRNESKLHKYISLFIGPEGGWSENELALFSQNNINQVSLGKNILRAETASIIAIGILLYEYEPD